MVKHGKILGICICLNILESYGDETLCTPEGGHTAWYRQVSFYAGSPHMILFGSGLKIYATFSNFHCKFQFNALWRRRYMIISDLTRFGIDDRWQHLSCVGG